MCVRNDGYFEMTGFPPGGGCRCSGGAAPLCLKHINCYHLWFCFLADDADDPGILCCAVQNKIDPDGRVWNLQYERVDQPNQCAKPYDTHDAHFKAEQGNESGCADQRREPLKGAVKPFRP